MADVKTSAETSVPSLTGAELVRVVQGGANAKTSVADIKTYVCNGQIPFPSSQNASGDPNILDDYEEGTFSASLGDGTNNYTLNINVCSYVKIGRQVTLAGFIAWNSIGSAGAGQLRMGFPFTIGGASGMGYGAAHGYLSGFDLTATLNALSIDVFQGETIVRFYRAADNAAPTAIPANSSSATGALEFTITYFF